ncbi:BcppoA90 [Apiospora kogelbergensis]|uniref:BcppoA90 n=1 Tax=Apiospora kogelbergensis TaxID=1337665 RepID=A0AAW0QJU2_9PEZI
MGAHPPSETSRAADRVLHYLLEGYRLYLAADDRSFWRRPACSGRGVANVSSAARDPDLYPNAAALDLDRSLDVYVAVGVEGRLLELLGAPKILAVLLELASYSGWEVISHGHGVPRRTNIPRRLWGITDAEGPPDGLGHAGLAEADWDFVERLQGVEDDSWTTVSVGCDERGSEDVVETGGSISQSEATVYVIGEGGQLSSIPDSLKVAWNYDISK